jgi:hypothetical protein
VTSASPDTFLQNPLGNPRASKPVLEWFPSFGPAQFAVAGAFGRTALWGYAALGLAWPAAFAAIGPGHLPGQDPHPDPPRADQPASRPAICAMPCPQAATWPAGR